MGNAVPVHSRERLGWTFVLAGSAVFLLLVISLPLLANVYLQQARRSLSIVLEAQQGTISLNPEQGLARAVLPDEPGQPFEAWASVRTGFPGNGFVSVMPPNSSKLLARIQLFAYTTLLMEEATGPRFATSDEPYQVVLHLENGRLHLKLLPDAQRPFFITLTTPHGHIQIDEPGEYAVEVAGGETQVMVQAGLAEITAVNQTFTLALNQRAVLYAQAAPVGPLIPQGNLIINNNFRQSLLSSEAGWQKSAWNIERVDLPKGELRQIQSLSQSSLRVTRSGVGHADIHIKQLLDVPVTSNATDLWLQIKFRIHSQSLEICGFQGSECPLFVQLAYEDGAGNEQTWQQGFYVLGGLGDTSPYACFSCAVVQSGHEQVVAGEVTVYEISMAEIGRLGSLPHHLDEIVLVISGHSFDVEILDVALFVTAIN